MADADLLQRVQATRRFNRMYTRRIGALREGLLGSDLALPEVRVLYEIALHDRPTAAVVARELDIDAGYMSRLVAKLERRGLIERSVADHDGRRNPIELTAAGWDTIRELDARSNDEVARMLGALPPAAQAEVVAAMRTLERLFGEPGPTAPITLRDPRPGDFGWIVERHGALYAAEHGWDASFEALVAEVASGILRGFDPRADRVFIAEQDGVRLGAACVVRVSDDEAKLRLLLVEPHARGVGLGHRLVAACVAFATEAGYRRLTLWTTANLVAARRCYERAGFRLVRSEAQPMFGRDLVHEFWERALGGG